MAAGLLWSKVMSKPYHDEISRKGGLSKSDAKMKASAVNLAKAQLVRKMRSQQSKVDTSLAKS